MALHETPQTGSEPNAPPLLVEGEFVLPNVPYRRTITTTEGTRSQGPDSSDTDEEKYKRIEARLQTFLEGSLQKMSTDWAQQNTPRPGTGTPIASVPPRFEGDNPREWLAQINQYYRVRGLTPDQRLEDVQAFLVGRALTHYCSTQQGAPELMPKTWEEFQEFMLQRFGRGSEATTIRKLQEIRFRGSVEEVAERFAEVLANGEQPSENDKKRYFLACFPYEMIEPYLNSKFTTWVQVREHLLTERAEKAKYAADWYCLTRLEYRQEVERRLDLRREGWITGTDIGDRIRAPVGFKPRRFAEDKPRGIREGQNQGGDNARPRNCFACGGAGHGNKECPNHNPEARRQGSKCNRCSGIGHWATSCPTKSVVKRDTTGIDKPGGVPRTQGNVKA